MASSSHIKIVWDEGFEAKAFHYRSSLNPLGDLVRTITDEIGHRAKRIVETETAVYEAERDSSKGLLKKEYKTQKMRYYRAKAMAYSLKIYGQTIRMTMEKDGDQNYGMVASYHARGDRIEFGGTDDKIELGKTGIKLDYPAFGFLRRAVNGG